MKVIKPEQMTLEQKTLIAKELIRKGLELKDERKGVKEKEEFSSYCLEAWYNHVREVLRENKILLDSTEDFVGLCEDAMDNTLNDCFICHEIDIQIMIAYKRMMREKDKGKV